MNKVAIAFLTKDRTELSAKTWPALCFGFLFPPPGVDVSLYWIDGSVTKEGKNFAQSNAAAPIGAMLCSDIRGGPDAAVAYALTTMLRSNSHYTHVGLCENDVLLDDDWYERTMALFDAGETDGLDVGAVSPRCYEDRILFQRDGYAVVHNIGWGCQIMTREAAGLALQHMRTGSTIENRRAFAQLSGLDIGEWWAFRAGQHSLCADWGNDKMLALNGLASLALTPSPVEMIGQTPPLAEQGLTLATGPVEARRNDEAFETYALRLQRIRKTEWDPCAVTPWMSEPAGAFVIFPHQMGALGGWYDGEWCLAWSQGFGPFSYKAKKDAWLEARISGPVEILVSGGLEGGTVLVEDMLSGYRADFMLAPEAQNGVVSISIPAGISYRKIRVEMQAPGLVFYGFKVHEPQPQETTWRFDHSVLPPVE